VNEGDAELLRLMRDITDDAHQARFYVDEVRTALADVRKLLHMNIKALDDHTQTIVALDQRVAEIEGRLLQLENR
jgi:hypothetical protein